MTRLTKKCVPYLLGKVLCVSVQSVSLMDSNILTLFFPFLVFTSDSDNILNGNAPPIASQKAFNIIADSLRRIDVSIVYHTHLCCCYLIESQSVLFIIFFVPKILGCYPVVSFKQSIDISVCVFFVWHKINRQKSENFPLWLVTIASVASLSCCRHTCKINSHTTAF